VVSTNRQLGLALFGFFSIMFFASVIYIVVLH